MQLGHAEMTRNLAVHMRRTLFRGAEQNGREQSGRERNHYVRTYVHISVEIITYCGMPSLPHTGALGYPLWEAM